MRDWQERTVPRIRDSVRQGHKRIVVQAATGAGKTLLAAHLFANSISKGKRPLFIVPDLSLIDQTIESFEKVGILDVGVIQGRHERTDHQAQVQIASVQTLLKRDLPEVDVVIVDECFPAGTAISTSRGPKPIEKIQPGDIVVNAVGRGRVLSLFKSSHNTFVRVRLSNGSSFRCTPDHPIFTSKGWKKAGDLEVREELFREEDLSDMRRAISPTLFPKRSTRGFPGIGRFIQQASMLQHLLLEEAEEPNAQIGGPGEGFKNPGSHRAQAYPARWEREASSGTSVADTCDVGTGMEGGVGGENPSQASALSPLLQVGSGQSGNENGDRVGWWKSLNAYTARTGSKEGCATSLPWVESVEIEELPCAEPVYNLRVSGHPSYFANGVLVHNCHVSYKGLHRLMEEPAWAEKIIIGMSATPWARGMGMHWTDLIIGATIAELIGNKVLCPFTVFGPGESIDRSKITVVGGEYDDSESAAVMSSAKVTADVVETWKKRWGKDKTFMFCVNRAHAREQQGKFEAAGVPWGYIDGNMTIDERKPVFAAFRSGRIKGIASVGCLSRGVDEDVHYIIDAQPTKSEMNLVQKIGRGLRNPGGGDKHLLVADHAGNQGPMGLGLVDDIFHDELDSRLPKDKTPAYGGKEAKKPNMCPSCNAYIRYGTVKCSLCGAVLRVASKVAHVAGELSEYAKAPKKSKVPATQADKQEFLSGFLSIAAKRGYTPGWAAHKYKERFGVWPRGLREVPAEPTKAVLDYEKYLRIRFIKSKGAASAK
jgi:DNA repair protein RadD